MSYNSIRADLETFLNTNYTADRLQHVRWDNAPFVESSHPYWIGFTVSFRNSLNAALGGSNATRVCVRRQGAVVADIFVKTDQGTGLATIIADELVTLFENRVIPGISVHPIQMSASDARNTGYLTTPGEDPEWYMYRVRIPFTNDV